MNKALLYILGLSTLIFLCLWLDACNRLKDSELTGQAIRSVWEADQKIADQQNAARDAFELAQDSVRKSDSARHHKTQSVLISEIKRLKGRILIPSNSGELKVDSACFDQLVLRDSVITAQDELTIDLTNERDSLKLSFEASIDTLNATIATQKWQISLADSLIKSVKVPAEPSRLSFGITGGASAVVANNQVFAGPGATVGLQYRIPIKINLRKLFRKR